MTQETAHQIAILVLDTAIDGITERFGDFGDNAIELLTSDVAAPANSPGPKHLNYVKYQCAYDSSSAPESYLPQLKETYSHLTNLIYDGTLKGIYLTGSRSDSFATDIPWIDELDKFVSTVLFNAKNFPIVGICFGHQIIAKNLGSKVGRNDPALGWELGTTPIKLSPRLLKAHNSPFQDTLSPDQLESGVVYLVESHHDVVHQIPVPQYDSSFMVIGATTKCAVQGLITESGPLKILTFQGHPEFSTPTALLLLERDLKLGYIDESAYDQYKQNTLKFENQGPLMGKVINRFFHNITD